jgi:hypothetical protein
MIETFEKQIGNSSYMITQLPARRALKLQAKMLKLLGPSAALIFAAAAKDLDSADNAIPQAVRLLSDQLDDKTFDLFVMELLQGVRKDGVELTDKTVDFEFAGNLNELFLVLQQVLEVNFGDFFQEGGILKSLMKKEEIEKIPRPSTRD